MSFVTEDEVREQGRHRQVVVEAHPGYCTLRLHGLRTGYPLSYAAIYQFAVRVAVEAERKEKKAKKHKPL